MLEMLLEEVRFKVFCSKNNFVRFFIIKFWKLPYDYLVNYTPTNSAIDVVVIEQPDGTLLGSPFHVNFGVRSVLHATDKKVFITVNGERTEIEMKLGKSGEGFFVKSFGAGEEPANPLSPVGTPPGSPRGGASLTRQGWFLMTSSLDSFLNN